jgi:thiol-disulfide isomerase/thioredoxin
MRALLAGVALLLALAGCGREPGDGRTPALEDYRGRSLVVNYWAEWCTPCIAEIPELNALDRAYPDVAVVGVNFDGATGDELAAQLDKLGVAFPTLPADPAPSLGIARPAVLPTTLILDPAGRLTATLVGPQTLESLARATGKTPPESETGQP